MIYDEEQTIRDLETLYKEKLNTAIDSINTEKGAISGDALFIPNIPSDKYIFETLDSRILNYTGFFIMYGLVDNPASAPSNNNFLEDLTVTIQVATFDKGELERSNTIYQLLRYRRALKKVIFENPGVFRGYANPLVASLKPAAFPYDSKSMIISIGLDIKASMTAN